MEYRSFGRTGLKLGVLGFGCGAVGGLMVRGSASDQDRAVGIALDAGINYFDTAEGSGTAPYVDEAARIDLAVREATTGPWARAYWTGDDLLLEGISHGATAPRFHTSAKSVRARPLHLGRLISSFHDGLKRWE